MRFLLWTSYLALAEDETQARILGTDIERAAASDPIVLFDLRLGLQEKYDNACSIAKDEAE